MWQPRLLLTTDSIFFDDADRRLKLGSCSSIHLQAAVNVMTREVNSLFVGSTMSDLEAYRRGVKEALDRASVHVQLSEDWIEVHDCTEKACRDRLHSADAYLGIFAHWYGSIPPGREQSITEIEYRWAVDRKAAEGTPMACFLPRPGKNADQELAACAEELYQNIASEAERCRRRELHKCFLKTVSNWKGVVHFDDCSELREQVLVVLDRFRLALMQLAVEPTAATRRQLSNSELGCLGRREHLDVVERYIAGMTGRQPSPALALLVSGDEYSGVTELLAAIADRASGLRGRGPLAIVRGAPGAIGCNSEVFIDWLGQGLNHSGVRDIAELASILKQSLQSRRLLVLFDRAHDYIGGVAALHSEVWSPLYRELVRLCSGDLPRGRLVLVCADYTTARGDYAIKATPAERDSELFWRLPELGAITRNDLEQWLSNMPTKVEGDAFRDLVDVALRKPGGGVDGTPSLVYGRLRSLDFLSDDSEDWS